MARRGVALRGFNHVAAPGVTRGVAWRNCRQGFAVAQPPFVAASWGFLRSTQHWQGEGGRGLGRGVGFDSFVLGIGLIAIDETSSEMSYTQLNDSL